MGGRPSTVGFGPELELLALAIGIKPAIRVRASPERVEAVARGLAQRGLAVETDPAEAVVYAARDPAHAAALRAAERPVRPGAPRRTPDDEVRGAHRELGRLLGYPRCCVEAYLARLERGVTRRPDGTEAPEAVVALEDALSRSELVLGRLVVSSARGRRLVPFEPCRFDCSLAGKYAGALFEAYAARDPASAARLEAELMRPIELGAGRPALRPDAF